VSGALLGRGTGAAAAAVATAETLAGEEDAASAAVD